MTMLRRKNIPFKVKEVSDTGEFSGYGSVFDVKDRGGDIVVKGAFSKTLDEWRGKGKLPKMLWQHDHSEPIGGYTVMREDDHGLYVEGRILIEAGTVEKRAHAHLKAGNVDGLSIGYRLFPGGIEYDKGQDAFLLKAVELWELSVVTFPMNTEATVDDVKSIIAAGPKEFERYLRDAGLSRSQAKGLMAVGFEGLRQREADADQDPVVKLMQNTLNTLRTMRGTKEK